MQWLYRFCLCIERLVEVNCFILVGEGKKWPAECALTSPQVFLCRTKLHFLCNEQEKNKKKKTQHIFIGILKFISPEER